MGEGGGGGGRGHPPPSRSFPWVPRTLGGGGGGVAQVRGKPCVRGREAITEDHGILFAGNSLVRFWDTPENVQKDKLRAISCDDFGRPGPLKLPIHPLNFSGDNLIQERLLAVNYFATSRVPRNNET